VAISLPLGSVFLGMNATCLRLSSIARLHVLSNSARILSYRFRFRGISTPPRSVNLPKPRVIGTIYGTLFSSLRIQTDSHEPVPLLGSPSSTFTHTSSRSVDRSPSGSSNCSYCVRPFVASTISVIPTRLSASPSMFSLQCICCSSFCRRTKHLPGH
jgi:hypothetical protein